MKIDTHIYKLNSPTLCRQGALLKIDFGSDCIGYADCHPWDEFGDAPLEQQLNLLKENTLTPLTEKSFYFAKCDAGARKQNIGLMEGLSVPESHFLITHLMSLSEHDVDGLINQRFEYVKIKLSKEYDSEAQQLIKLFGNRSLRLRLDFNGKLSAWEFTSFLYGIRKIIHLIDFIEDPFPFDEDQWTAIQQRYEISLACDRYNFMGCDKPHAAKIVIIKPAIQFEAQFQTTTQKRIITSYLDHPLGQVAAAWESATLNNSGNRIDGLNSHYVYEPNPFSKALSRSGPQFIAPQGTGFGFDDLFQELPWKPLI